MEKIEINVEKLKRLAKKQKRIFENYYIKPYAYTVNNSLFFFTSFKKRGKTTGYSVLSLDSTNADDHFSALKPLLHYGVAIGNIYSDGKYRANVDFNILYEVRDYLQNVIEAEVLDYKDLPIYKRSMSVMQKMLDSQEELKYTYKKAIEKYELDKKKGYITDDDITEMKNFIPVFMKLQHNQYFDRYHNRKDFDVIFKNRNHPEIKKFNKFKDPNTLREMTTNRAEVDLKKALETVSYVDYFHKEVDSEYEQVVLDDLNNELKNFFDEVLKLVRYPKN